eukprot:scpid46339/ scgid13394/ DNA repair protein XRCC1; X-ray repair cross-complementing protein 1
MPVIRVSKVLRCSSEDPVFSSKNLLLTERYRKFVCHQSNQADRIEVDLQLASPSQITNIDLGNNGSAFISMLVGRSGSANEKEFVGLLPETMLQTPIDARAGRHKASVRLFRCDSLSPSSRDQYWDLVRIILRQPYKTRDPFGLSFLKFQGVEQESTEETSTTSRSHEVGSSRSPVTAASSTRSSTVSIKKDDPDAAPGHLRSRNAPVLKPSLPGSAALQLATSAGSTYAKAPQRLLMSRVRRMDTSEMSAIECKKPFCDSDGVTLRSDLVKAEMMLKGQALSSASTAKTLGDSIDVGAQKRKHSPGMPDPSSSPPRKLATPSCSSAVSPRIGSLRGPSDSGKDDFIEFEPAPTTPRRTPASAAPKPRQSSVLDRIDAQLQQLDSSRTPSVPADESDGVTPRRSFLDARNKERTPRGQSGVNFMSSYTKDKPKLPSDVAPTVLGLGGADEEVDDKGVRIEQRVDDDGRVTFKKIERRPMPKPVVTLKTRFKPNKQMKIGTLLNRMKASADGSGTGASNGSGNQGNTCGWMQAHDSSRPLPNTDIMIIDDDDMANAALTMPAYSISDHSVPAIESDQLEAEIHKFLDGIDFDTIDLETVTFRDMRHQFEYSRGQELDRAQHRTFLTLARSVVERVTDTADAEDDVQVVDLSHQMPSAYQSTKACASLSLAESVQCPLCQSRFPQYAIEAHAASCC